MSTTKVSLGGRTAASNVVGSIEYHYGHSFVVQEDLTLVCDMDDAFVDAETAIWRVKLYKPAKETVVIEPPMPPPKATEKHKGHKKGLEVTPPPSTGADT